MIKTQMCVLVGATLAAAIPAFAQTAQVRALGVLDDRTRDPASFANGLSSDGRFIVGGSHVDMNGNPQMQACRWEWAGAANPSAPLALTQHASFGSMANAVSDDGDKVVGNAGFVFEFWDGFKYLPMESDWWWGVNSPAPTTGGIDQSYELSDISRDGTFVAGTMRDPLNFESAPGMAMTWTGPAQIPTPPTPLGTLGGALSQAHACTGDGAMVIGAAHNAGNTVGSFQWTALGGMLPVAGVPTDEWSEAHGVSGNGVFIVGALISDSYRVEVSSGVMTTIARLAGTGWSVAEDATNDGKVVGYTTTDTENGFVHAAFIWDAAHGTRSIAQMLLQDHGLDTNGWEFHKAMAISDDGQTIVGWGRSPTGIRESWAVRLNTSPCGSADFDGDGDTGTDADIEAYFACLGGNCCETCGSADFDGDGDTGTDADIEAFFRVLGGGAC